MGRNGAAVLITALGDENAGPIAATVLGKIKEDQIEPLMGALKDPNAVARRTPWPLSRRSTSVKPSSRCKLFSRS